MNRKLRNKYHIIDSFSLYIDIIIILISSNTNSKIAFATERNCVDIRKLIVNMRDCCVRIEMSIQSGTDFEVNHDAAARINKFRECVVLSVLLSCPCIRSDLDIAACAQLQMQMQALPTLSDTLFYQTVRALNYQAVLQYLLPVLPSRLIVQLIRPFLSDNNKALAPGQVCLNAEFCSSLLFRLSRDDNQDCLPVVHLIVEEMKRAAKELINISDKSSAYLFLHILQMIYNIVYFISGSTIEGPSIPKSYEPLSKMFLKDNADAICDSSSHSIYLKEETAISLIECAELVAKQINVDSWISWSEMDIQGNFFCSTVSLLDSSLRNSLQTNIRIMAFKCLKIFQTYECSLSSVKNSNDELHLKCLSGLWKFTQFINYLKEIALDPENDPDTKLSLMEIVMTMDPHNIARSLTSEPTPKEWAADPVHRPPIPLERKLKLLKYLVNWKSDLELFKCTEASFLLMNEIEFIHGDNIEILIKRFLNYGHNVEVGLSWKMVS